MAADPQLITLDWGSTNLRARLLDGRGAVLALRSAAVGVMAVPERRFADALQALCGDWIEAHAVPLVASGMIGSRQGWQEAPYLDCPAGLAEAAARLTQVELKPGSTLHIVPGLHCVGGDGQDDVMRGEETQLWGAGLPAGACCVLPGTHSKWAWLGDGGRIERFQTFMTGELYALLTQHGILGRLMDFGSSDAAAFEAGVRHGLAEHGRATYAVFAARSAGLLGRFAAPALPDFLSGILVGAEVGGALQGARPAAVSLLGDGALCTRYATALALAGVASERCDDDATTRGQWRLACAAGLVAAAA